MNRKILLVDDEQAVLDSFRNLLRRHFDVYVARGSAEGLEVVQGPARFAVVVSDLRMPGMDGLAFLNRVREISPDTVRMMLTGFADLEAAMAAVNEDQVFRFLAKPCPPKTMVKALSAGLEQYRLVTAERELLRDTLRGAIQVLTEALSMANPEAYGRAHRIRTLVRRMAKDAGIPVTWELDLAAMLSHIGCMALPRALLKKIAAGEPLTEEEDRLYARHPAVGANLLGHIPRLEHVAEMIGMQQDRHDASVCTGDRCVIARLLKLATDYDMFEGRGLSPADILARMRADEGAYDPGLFAALERGSGKESDCVLRRIGLKELEVGMVLEEGIVSAQGLLLLAQGTEVNRSALARLRQAEKDFDVVQPFLVRSPVRSA